MIEDEFDVDFADTFCSQSGLAFTLRKPNIKCETGVQKKTGTRLYEKRLHENGLRFNQIHHFLWEIRFSNTFELFSLPSRRRK